MRAFVSLVVLLFASAASAEVVPPAEQDIIVRADVARNEIERILNADNLDTVAMHPHDVAQTISIISRGRAPDDFWRAYQRHVDAWVRMAELTERANGQAGAEELAKADRMINLSFDEVERIARRYGARMPMPMTQVRRTA
jgi:hypothetical protein